jgi:ABC-type transport system involved in multi-copper enzyme maturation permease subunit
MIGYLAIILVTCLTTTTLAMFASVVFRKTSVSMLTSYLVVILLFAMPVAAKLLCELLFPHSELVEQVKRAAFVSPFAAAFSLPLHFVEPTGERVVAQVVTWWPWTCVAFLAFYAWLDVTVLWLITRLFHMRWRLAQQ